MEHAHQPVMLQGELRSNERPAKDGWAGVERGY